MKLRDFVNDRCFAYITYTLAFAVMLMFMTAFRILDDMVMVLSFVFWLPIIISEIWDFSRRKKFYDDMLRKLDVLDQKYLIYEMLENPSFYEGHLMGEILRVTNRSMYENVAEYRRSVSDFREFIEMWVHEIKLPVSSLLLMTHNHKNEFSSRAHEQLRRIDGYTDTVLYYARAENAGKDYLIKETSLKRTISNAALKNREDLLLHNVKLQTENLDVSIMTDSKWLEFIIGQLIANSLKFFSDKRDPMITIFAEDLPDRTILHFKDNGIGISESDLPYIFEKSFTGENGRIHAKSTGMGLYIVKNLCERLGHQIEAVSVKNEFTEFTITFSKNNFYKFD